MGRFLINDIHIGPLTLHVYGLMMGLGIICAYLISDYRARRRGMDADALFWMAGSLVIGGLIGAKVLFLLVSTPSIIADPSILWDFSNGWVVYGALIGGAIGLFVYSRYKKLDFLSYVDLMMPSVAFAQGLGRIGCLFAGCCYGQVTDGPFGLVYVYSHFAPNGVPLIPTQIISSIGNFAISAVLFAYAAKYPRKGRVTAGYCLLYSVGRFIIEFFRSDYRGELGFLSTSQVISVFIFALGVFLIVKSEPLLNDLAT